MNENDIHEIEDVSPEGLLARVDALKLDDWRLVQILCVALADGRFELTYSFGGDLAMWSLRTTLGAHDAIPSVTALYPAAFLYENEIRDLFGVRIERIEPDWRGKVYGGTAEKPFRKLSVTPASSEGGTR